MAITWGSTVGHVRVGIDIVVTSSSNTQVSFEVQYYVQSVAWGFNDNQRLNLSGDTSGHFDYHLSSGTGQTVTLHVGTRSYTRTRVYGGGPTLSFRGTVSGNVFGDGATHVRSYTVPARPPSPTSAPGQPTATPAANGATVKVTWAAPSNNNGSAPSRYQVQYARNSGFTTGVSSAYTTSRSHTANTSAGTTYWVRVRAENAAGWSAWSSSRSFTTNSAPSAPGQPTVSGLQHDRVTLAWSAPSSTGGAALSQYQVQVARNSGFTTGLQTQTQSASSRTHTFTGLLRGTGHFARVRASNAVGWGSWSSVRTFTTADVPSTPAKPTVTNVEVDQATVNWAAPSDGGMPITGYHVQVSLDAGFTQLVRSQSVSAATLSLVFTDLDPGVVHFVRVRAVNAAGNGPYSPTADFETLAGAKVRVGGAWVNAKGYSRVSGQQVLARVHKRVNGQWVL